jgi:hypothetical protein
MNDERERSSLDDDRPGSQGEIEAGSEGDFGGSNEPSEPTEGGLGTGGAAETDVEDDSA